MGYLGKFRRQHLFDYSPRALRLWLANCAFGAAALGWALYSLVLDPWNTAVTLLGLAATVVAAMSTIRISSTLAVSLADVVIFALLGGIGAPAAILAAGLEGWLGASRASSRMSSRLHTPAIAMLSMALVGAVFNLLRDGGVSIGLPEAASTIGALGVAGLCQYLFTTGWFSLFLATKTDQDMNWNWLHSTAWIAALQMGAATVAGVGS